MAGGRAPALDRLHQIDSLRGIASLGVAIPFHFRYLTGDRSITDTAAMPLGEFLPMALLYRHGDVLVELFFVISGFVFHHVYRQDGRPTTVGVRAFALARFARLYPLLFVSTIVSGLLILGGGALYGAAPLGFAATPADWARNLLGLQMLRVEPPSLNAASWSVSVEILCYILFYLLAVRSAALFYGGAMLCAGVGLWSLSYVGFHPGWLPGWFVARGLLGFFVGVLLYALLPRLMRLPAALLWLLLIGASLGAWYQPGPLGRVAVNALLTCLVFPIVILLAFRRPLDRILDARPLRRLGDLSYSIYLVHMPVLLTIIVLHGNRPLDPGQYAIGLIGFLILAILVGEASFRWLEMPARRRLRGTRPRVAMSEFPA